MPLNPLYSLVARHTGWVWSTLGAARSAAILERRMGAAGLDEASYVERVHGDPNELRTLIEELAVVETWFLRNQALFSWLRERLGAHQERDCLRLLSAPCASGEEAYSLVVTALEAGLDPERVQVVGVDLSAHAVARAREATYGDNAFRGVAASWQRRWFLREGARWRVRPEVHAAATFSQGNLLADGPWCGAAPYDVILCRNLLIYMDEQSGRGVTSRLAGLLRPGGVLVMAPTDVPNGTPEGLWPLRVGHCAVFEARGVPPVLPAARGGAEPAGVAGPAQGAPPVEARRPRGERPAAEGRSGSRRARPLPAERAPAGALWAGPRRLPAPPPEPSRRSARGSGIVEPSDPPASAAPSDPPAKGASEDREAILTLANAGDLAEALRRCEDQLSVRSSGADGYFLCGVLRDRLGHLDEARAMLRRCLYLDPYHADALSYLAELAQAEADPAAATRLRSRARRALAAPAEEI